MHFYFIWISNVIGSLTRNLKMLAPLHAAQTWRSRLSMASRCGWMRMGLRRSLTRDSAMSTDSLYSSLASSCRRKWVDFLTLQKESSQDWGFVHSYKNKVHPLQYWSQSVFDNNPVIKLHKNTGRARLTCSTGSVAPGLRARHGSACRNYG